MRLDDLAAALEADRKLRLGGSTPPSEEQLAYSTALVHPTTLQTTSQPSLYPKIPLTTPRSYSPLPCLPPPDGPTGHMRDYRPTPALTD